MTSSHLAADDTPARVFRAILFLDVVGPLQMARTEGDERGWMLLSRIKHQVHPRLEASAAVMKDLGDRYMASFETIPAALDAAIAIQRAVAAEFEGEEKHPRLRIGIHAGDILESQNDLYGVEVYLANRVCAYAEGGEIMVTEAVRQRAEQAGGSYNDHGDVLLQSFEHPVRVWELCWRATVGVS